MQGTYDLSSFADAGYSPVARYVYFSGAAFVALIVAWITLSGAASISAHPSHFWPALPGILFTLAIGGIVIGAQLWGALVTGVRGGTLASLDSSGLTIHFEGGRLRRVSWSSQTLRLTIYDARRKGGLPELTDIWIRVPRGPATFIPPALLESIIETARAKGLRVSSAVTPVRGRGPVWRTEIRA